MNCSKICLLVPIILGFITNLSANEHDGKTRFQQELEESDLEILNDLVNQKRSIPLDQKWNNLNLSGCVRARYYYSVESVLGHNVRGGDSVYIFRQADIVNNQIFSVAEKLPISRNEFDVEFNLRIDYCTDNTWASALLMYDQSAGVDDNLVDGSIDPEGYHGSGSCDNFCLKKAYLGYNLFNTDLHRFDVEAGRIGNLYCAFDSQIQFLSRLDGILLTYRYFIDDCSDCYAKWAGFVVDERANQCAWIVEVGWENIYHSDITLKYSFIDWRENGSNRYFVKDPIGYQFKNSQITASYVLPYEWYNQCWQVYGAFLINHIPSGTTFSHGVLIKIPKKNLGWYLGLRIGELCKEGDWTVDLFYAAVQAQCMPDNDVRRIGIGNALNESFTSDARGNTNWQGWQVCSAYALTDNLIFNTWLEYATAADPQIGGEHKYASLLFETIYTY